MKTAIVTGASGGIGAAIAVEMAKNDYTVAVHYHGNEAAAKETVAQIAALGGSAFAVRADIRDEDQVKAMTEEVLRRCGDITLLVNNAGVSVKGLTQDMSAELWDDVFAVNVRGAFLCVKYILPAMLRRQNGCIINISSMWGVTGASFESLYSASKAALIGYTKSLAKELAPSGIRVNAIAPGLIETPMNGDLSAEAVAELIDVTPLGRIGKPGDIAAAVCFLADDAKSGFITGQSLCVDGGFVI